MQIWSTSQRLFTVLTLTDHDERGLKRQHLPVAATGRGASRGEGLAAKGLAERRRMIRGSVAVLSAGPQGMRVYSPNEGGRSAKQRQLLESRATDCQRRVLLAEVPAIAWGPVLAVGAVQTESTVVSSSLAIFGTVGGPLSCRGNT